MNKFLVLLGAALLAACGAPAVRAQGGCVEEKQMDKLIRDYLPQGYAEVSRRAVTADGEALEWVRYQPVGADAVRLGGEHFSTVATPSGCLKGFAWMGRALEGGTLPDKKQAQAVAERFLREYAPDLAANKEVHWVDTHDEPLRFDGRDITLTGMKVKMRNPADGRWFWVIVGNHGRAMVFERDIVWVSFPGHRQTEKWLHDAWLAERGG